MRLNMRSSNQMRKVEITRHFTKYAEGSVLITMGDTQVLCNATVSAGVPYFLKNSGQGWITAEYGMLPRSTHSRMEREAGRKQGGRTVEIQRLIGRSLRAAVDLAALGEYTITLDCDVLQADGGTRTAAITGSCVALYDALSYLRNQRMITVDPFKHWIAAISVGIYEGQPVLDLDYPEDSNADMDMNVVMSEQQQLIEIQGTAEKSPFNQSQLQAVLSLAADGIGELIQMQKAIIGGGENLKRRVD